MDIQTRKMQFIEEYLRITDESLLEKLSVLLRKERQKQLKTRMQPMSQDELAAKLDRSEDDIQAGRVYSQSEVEAHLKSRRKKA
jgi:hypothetical protein